jgi:hypothetical protein
MIIFKVQIYTCETNKNKDILTVSKNNKGVKLSHLRHDKQMLIFG